MTVYFGQSCGSIAFLIRSDLFCCILSIAYKYPYVFLFFFRSFGTAFARARRLVSGAVEPHDAPSPFQYFNLLKLLNRPLGQINLVEENVEFRTGGKVRPHTFYIKVLFIETTDEGPKTIRWSVIAKVMGRIEESNDKALNIRGKLEREILIYSTVLKSFDAFQQLWPAVEIKYCDLFPICYGCAFSLENEDAERADHTAAILLQNLESSYQFIMEPCDIDLARLIVKRLALLHATPIALAMQSSNSYMTKLENTMIGDIRFDPEFNNSNEFLIISNILYGHPDYTQYLASLSYHLALCAHNLHSDCIKEVPAWTTICHRKCSIRKIMHKQEGGSDDNRGDIKFVDTRYMEHDSCVSDLVFFMLTSIPRHVLDRYFDDILQTYFSEFNRIMSVAYIQLPEHTYENFVAEFDRRAEWNIGPILFEIGRLHFDGKFGQSPMRGVSYVTKLKEVLSFMKDKGWLKRE